MEEQKSWFKRNWIWVVPGCGCLGLILVVVFGLGAAFFGVKSVFESSSPYKHAVELAKTNPEIVELLGEPIETDGMMNGNISVQNDSGSANFSVPLKGPNGKATLVVLAERFDGEWVYEGLYVTIKESQERINLLEHALEAI